MKLLFFNVACKVFHNSKGELFLNPHITNEGFMQYRQFCDELILLLRDGGEIDDNNHNYERFDPNVAELRVYPNILSRISDFISINKHRELRRMINKAVQESDKVICGAQGGYITEITVEACHKYNKPYMVYCLGMMFEGQWYHSWKGKLVAFPRELSCMRVMKHAPYAIYVTEEASQKRYPCSGKSIGCSDVEIQNLSQKDLDKRLIKIKNHKGPFVFGTAAHLDVKWKGQQLLIKRLAELSKKGLEIEYWLLGNGKGDYLRKIARKYGVENKIKYLGACPHAEVFKFYENIDVYIQPSYQEGLCRSIVEAMSKACPVVCSDAGGNYELIQEEFIFHKGNSKALQKKIEYILSVENLTKAANRNFERAKDFDKEKLNAKRWDFIRSFIDGD